MHIRVSTDGCPFELEIGRVVRLFFEDAQVDFRTQDSPVSDDASTSPDVVIDLRLVDTGRTVQVIGRLTGVSRQNEGHTATYSRAVSEGADRVARRKLGKHVTLHVLHQLFQQLTGVHQPWGYLTGIRPLKIVHTFHTQGMDEDAVRRNLVTDYLLLPDRADLLLDIARRQLAVVPELYRLHQEVSVYIGIPFCPTHCAYCTFPAYSMQDKATYVDDFLDAMDVELKHLGQLLREYNIGVTSVYIGGGTPTSLRAFELDRLLSAIQREIPGRDHWRELTVEAGRPDTITPDRVRVMRAHGVDRISVNPQTFKASTLQHIRRGHTPDQVDHRFHHVRDNGFDNINMDMILGLPGESLDDVRYTMERIERLDPDSITVHTMSLKRSAAVTNHRDTFRIPENETVRQMMDETKAWVTGLGHHPYYVYRQMDILGNQENIGYAKTGKESVYNVCIMEERQTIVGIGGGAVTKLIGANGQHYGRLANPREPKAYIDTVEQVVAKKDRLLRTVFESIQPAGVN